MACDVCRKDKYTVVRASACGPVSLAYCEDCLKSGAEPYDFLISYLGCAGATNLDDINEGYLNHVVIPTLNMANKTKEDLINDLIEEDKKMEEYYNSLRPNLEELQKIEDERIEEMAQRNEGVLPDIDIDLLSF